MTPIDWQPCASRDMLAKRAALLRAVREFMHARDILEVQTPVLSRSAPTEPDLLSLQTAVSMADGGPARTFYLHTSPEFAMKRLVAAGSGPVYQLCRVFRDGESGALHQPEFTMLEWYRPGMDHEALMDEVTELLHVLHAPRPERISYAAVFSAHLNLCPHTATDGELAKRAAELGLTTGHSERTVLLDFLFDRAMAAQGEGAWLVFDFPLPQAMLAKVRPGPPPVAERFELFLDGMEIANGYHELCDAEEQARRFDAGNARRRSRGLPEMPVDRRLLAALQSGLPDCAGVALGIERLLCALQGCTRMSEVEAFPPDRA